MAFESGVVAEDWRSAVIVLLYKGKGGMIKYKNYRGITLLSGDGKTYEGILVNKVPDDLIDDEQGSFRSGMACVDIIFTLKEIGEKACEKKAKCDVGVIDLKKAYDRINREAI